MKLSHLLVILSPFFPALGMLVSLVLLAFAPKSENFGFVPAFPPLFWICALFYVPALWLTHQLAHTYYSFFHHPGTYGFFDRYLLLPACVLQSALLSFLLWRFLRAYRARRDSATDLRHRDA